MKTPDYWGIAGYPVSHSLTPRLFAIVGEKLNLTLWGRNVADEEYLAEVIPAPEFGGSFIHQAPYATYGIDLKYNF